MKIKCVEENPLLHFDRFCLLYEGHSNYYYVNGQCRINDMLEGWASPVILNT